MDTSCSMLNIIMLMGTGEPHHANGNEASLLHSKQNLDPVTLIAQLRSHVATQLRKRCVARMTCLYKNNGAVSCHSVEADFLFIWSLYPPKPPSQQSQERMSACADVTLYRIY